MSIELCRESGIYEGGCELTANWRVSRVTLDRVAAIELSVLWYTEGKGDTDLNVHFFQRFEQEQVLRSGLADRQSLHCVLPATPLSYHGRLIRLRWCVRLRLFMANGREVVTNQPFFLVAPQSGQNGTAVIRSV
ncbi:hypothetical protein [Rhodopirellula sp. MGV]|uniref:hypothetical protein n=1 Tax=Rhodopirellula sp. MGV TaxID=2023130 RepID=UPI000B95EF71|nr:hypothetical protein [Rhodopirellula sp. MGV]OYP35193.1 hypothetical protein CGZ80_12400 [Rhodopirellula sp. MGV]PNY37793.1 hypothetical protein C2E31_05900 [Rhodopirellula baltica]